MNARRGFFAALGSFFGKLPKYLLWLVASTILWLWIFTFLTDAPAAKKVTLYADVPALAEPGLSVALEEHMPEGIRMIRAHAFDYFMFGDPRTGGGDLYVLPVSAFAAYRSILAPIDPPEGADCYVDGGAAYGVKVYDAATGEGAALDYIRYTGKDLPAEDYYLFFGKDSLHTGAQDTAAYFVAERFLRLP